MSAKTQKALDLFQAYLEQKLQYDGGYIISSFLGDTSTYAHFEVIAYNGVKSIYMSDEGLTFQSDGNKVFILVEPATYPRKFEEPFRRIKEEQIPHRFSELEILTTREQTKVMVSREPIMTYGSFTILKPAGNNFAFLFPNLPDVRNTIKQFFEETLSRETKVPKHDASKAAELILGCLDKFTVFKS
jgi:hypothetical protein